VRPTDGLRQSPAVLKEDTALFTCISSVWLW